MTLCDRLATKGARWRSLFRTAIHPPFGCHWRQLDGAERLSASRRLHQPVAYDATSAFTRAGLIG